MYLCFQLKILPSYLCFPLEKMNAELFLKLGNKFTNTKSTSSKYIAERRFASFFGVSPEICIIVWDRIKPWVPTDGEPKHLLWSLSFLKQYAVEHYRSAIFKADEKTVRKWTWLFVKILSDMDVVPLFRFNKFILYL